MRARLIVVAFLLSACASSPELSRTADGPPGLPLEAGYYVYSPINSNPCGEYESAMALTHDVALRASRDLISPVVATARGGETVSIVDCRVHFRPRRGEVLRTQSGFEAGHLAYMLYSNEDDWDLEDFEHTDVIDHVWYQGRIVEVSFETPEDLFSWDSIGPGMSRQLQDGAGGGCWYLLEGRGVRGWGQSADIDCYWTHRRGAAE
jgi:hypothetical protein